MADIPESIESGLIKAFRDGSYEDAEAATLEALEADVDPLTVIQEVVIPALTEIGQDFQDFKIFLPELMMAGEAAKRSTELLEQAVAESGGETSSLGTVVVGTVEKDVHDIGKNILAALLTANGFTVVDIGRDVSPSAFLDAARKENADIVAMSSLMTTTRPVQRSTIRLFAEVGEADNYKLIVGGGCVDSGWAEEIGAAGYAPDAAAAVDLCKDLLRG